jgi:hypothetical protein
MNVTLAVFPLGEEEKWKTISTRHGIYVLSSLISGGISGFIYASIIFLMTFWMPFLVKMYLLIFLLTILVLYEYRMISLKKPERKWQIPSSWLDMSRKKNMIVWGIVLGTGVWTYNPYTLLYALYVYIGFFRQPYDGLLIGLIYAVSRTIPTILVAALRKTNVLKERHLIKNLWGTQRFHHILNVCMLTFFTFYFMFSFFTQ